MEQEVKKETKICKYCKTEIPKNAKVCPVCRKKQKHIGGFIALGIVALIVVIIIAANAGSDSKPKKVGDDKSASSGSSDSEEKDVFTNGEIAEMNGVQVTLKDYEESKGTEFLTPDDGNVFVIVTFEIANNSDSEISVSSIASFEAYVDDYSVSTSISAESVKDGVGILDGTVAAGKKMSGIIGYEVPKDWKNMEISFTDNVWSDSAFKFEINK